jgi:hypothetical protein
MKTQQESYNGNAEETNKQESNTELIEKHEIPNTPFIAMRIEKDWYLMMGRFRINIEIYNSKEEAIESANDATWNRIIQVMGIMIEHYGKEKEIIGRLDELEKCIKK